MAWQMSSAAVHAAQCSACAHCHMLSRVIYSPVQAAAHASICTATHLTGSENIWLMTAAPACAKIGMAVLQGLDSYAALNVMAHMNALAAMGQTIILSVHQPRAAIFEALHKVCSVSLRSRAPVLSIAMPMTSVQGWC